MLRKIVVVILSMILLLSGCSSLNYSSSIHPSEIKIYKFNKAEGYHVTRAIKNENTVTGVWRIVQHMKRDKAYKQQNQNLSPRLCFDFSSKKKLDYNCFEISGPYYKCQC